VLAKLFAGISGFVFIALAAMFGLACSPDISNDVKTFGSVGMVVGPTAFVHGIVFGRKGFSSGTLLACFALVVMSLPFELLYGTAESLIRYFAAIIMMFGLVSLGCFLGTLVRRRWAS